MFLYQLVGASAFIGVGIMVVLMCFAYYFGKMLFFAHAREAKDNDARVSSINEVVYLINHRCYHQSESLNSLVGRKILEKRLQVYERRIYSL